jgi:hypothetical protein
MTTPARSPLACRLFGHDPDPFPRWNEGYYFARCRRCGTQLVRTAYGRWQLPPRGFRIVWSTVRPDSLAAAPMLLDPADLLPEPPPPPAELRKPPVSYVPDFMDDAKTDTSWRHHLPPTDERTNAQAAATEPKSSRADFARLIPPLRRSAAEGEERSRPARGAAVAIVLLSVLLIVVMLFIRNDGARATAATAPPAPAIAMYVMDGMTSCRAIASSEAGHVRYLVRGDRVRLLAREGDWAAISYGGQQCWVPLALLSEDPIA